MDLNVDAIVTKMEDEQAQPLPYRLGKLITISIVSLLAGEIVGKLYPRAITMLATRRTKA